MSSTGNDYKAKACSHGHSLPPPPPPPRLLANVWCTESHAVDCITWQFKATVPPAAMSAWGTRAQLGMGARQPRHHEQGWDCGCHTAAPCAYGNPWHCQVESLLTTSLPIWGLGPSVPPGSPARHLGIKAPSAQRGSVVGKYHPRGPRGYHRPNFPVLTALPASVLHPAPTFPSPQP